jgi:hypothetical protein
MPDYSLRERCEKRLASLKNLRTPYEEEAREIARYAAPARTRFNHGEKDKNHRVRNKALYSNKGITSFRMLTGGMTSGLTSSSRPWFALATHDAELMEQPDVREWLTEVTRRLYAFLAGTNFYGAAKTGYSELGLFGTEAAVMVEDPVFGMVCHPLTFGEYWIGLDMATQVDTLYRRVPMSTIQAVQMFGLKNLRSSVQSAYDNGNYEQPVEIIHAIEPNLERDPNKLDRRGMEYRSIWWDEADESAKNRPVDRDSDGEMVGLLRNRGYPEKPFWCARWDTTGGDAWGTGPGADALPDLRELQLQSKRKAEATDMHVWPEIVVPASVRLRRQPKAVIAASSVDVAGIKVPYQVDYRAIEAIRLDVEKCEQNIDEATYADLFMAITNMRGIQPRNIEEIASRNEEKLTQLGPVIERVNVEKLEVVVDRSFAILGRMEGGIPPAPEVIAGMDLAVDFISILAQMQRMVGIGQIERTVSFIGNLAGVFPDAPDKLNIDEVIDEYADRAGAPQKIIRRDDEVREIRDARAQAAQAQAMAAAAPAAKDGAEAARLLSETDVGGESMLDRMMAPAP